MLTDGSGDSHRHRAVAALGIKTVINLNRDADVREQRLVEQAGMAYLHIPMTTHVPPTPDQIFAQFLGAVTAVAGQPVCGFLHPEFKKFVFAFTPRPPATPASVPFGTAGSAPGW